MCPIWGYMNPALGVNSPAWAPKHPALGVGRPAWANAPKSAALPGAWYARMRVGSSPPRAAFLFSPLSPSEDCPTIGAKA